ncbi:MAG: hypothetical protein JXA66_08700, partial [Oligoflexia bacterium]|nr:hypothetical protein [Oligoflexia bacterium]
MKDLTCKRIAIVFTVILIMLFVLVVQAFRLQVLPSKKIADLAERQYRTEIKLSSKRGEIYDRNREALATTVEVDSLYASPRMIQNKKKIAEILSKKLGLRYLRVLSSISNKKYFVWIKRLLTEAESEKIRPL